MSFARKSVIKTKIGHVFCFYKTDESSDNNLKLFPITTANDKEQHPWNRFDRLNYFEQNTTAEDNSNKVNFSILFLFYFILFFFFLNYL